MQRKKKKIISVYLLLLFSLGILLLPLPSLAVTLSLDSSSSQYQVGDTFIVNVRLGVEKEESVNAVEANIQFPPSLLKAKDFSTGNSVLTFIDKPVIDNNKGIISFSGIIPGGYSGQIPNNLSPDILLGKIIFKARFSGLATINLFSSRVLLNDGKGTPAALNTRNLILNIQKISSPSPAVSSEDQWQKTIREDTTPPEKFQPILVKINGKYYLSLNSKDKGSGIDYYLVRESRLNNCFSHVIPPSWVCASLPLPKCSHKTSRLYLLKDQSLSSIIKIQAVDKAGNTRTVTVMPQHYEYLKLHRCYIIGGSIFLLLTLLLFILFRVYVKSH